MGLGTALMETRIAGVMLLLSGLLTSWKLALDAASKSPKTTISFLDSARRLEAYLAAQGLPPKNLRAFGPPGGRVRPHFARVGS